MTTTEQAIQEALLTLIAIDQADDDRDFLNMAECEAINSTIKRLRKALAAKQQQHEAHRLAYPGGGGALFDKLWHLTFNCVTAHAGNHVKTDLLPMQEMREFLEHLCCLVDSPPIYAELPNKLNEPTKNSKPYTG